MVDTGASPNLVKRRNVHPETSNRETDKLYLSGITDGRIKTLGSIQARYMGHPLELHVVNDNFPIPREDILGNDFLRDASNIHLKEKYVSWQGIQIPFAEHDTIVIPARSRTTFHKVQKVQSQCTKS